MLPLDPTTFLTAHREQLLRELDRQRLLAQLPRRESALRHTLAAACLRAADWLDGSTERYFSPPEPGPARWA